MRKDSAIILAHHATCVSLEGTSFANNGNNEFFFLKEIVEDTFFPIKMQNTSNRV